MAFLPLDPLWSIFLVTFRHVSLIWPVFWNRVPVFWNRVPIFGYRVPVFGNRMPVFGYRVPVFGYRVPIFRYWVPIFGRIWGMSIYTVIWWPFLSVWKFLSFVIVSVVR